MAKEIGVKGQLRVRTLKQRFLEEFGVTIRVYHGVAFADDEATLASVRVDGAGPSKEFSIHGSTLVANVEKQFKDCVGVRIRIEGAGGGTADKSATLASLRGLAVPPSGTDADESSKGIHVHGNSQIGKLKKEFNEKFPYIRLGIYSPETKAIVAKGETIRPLPPEKRIVDVRTKVSSGDVSIHGKKKVVTLETEFETEYGLYAQVCYTAADGQRYYTSGDLDEMGLSALNRHGEAQGWKKDVWK